MANITHLWALTRPAAVRDRYFSYLRRLEIMIDLEGAHLEGAHLEWENLEGAHLERANLDYSSGLPLWCGGLGVNICPKIAKQLVYHAFAQNCDDPEYNRLKSLVADFANGFHRVGSEECEVLK